MPVPAIVTKELWEKAHRRAPINKKIAPRNKKVSKDCLLQGGFAKCGYCGLTASPIPKSYILTSGEETSHFSYKCPRLNVGFGKCPGCVISVDLLDKDVKEYIKKLLHDRSKAGKQIKRLLAENPISKQQQQKIEKLNQILLDQERLRVNLSAEMKKATLGEQTVAILGSRVRCCNG